MQLFQCFQFLSNIKQRDLHVLGLRSVSYWDFGSLNGAILEYYLNEQNWEIKRSEEIQHPWREASKITLWRLDFFSLLPSRVVHKRWGTLLRGCLRRCASGGNHLTFKLCLCSFGQTSRPMMGSALNLASQEDQFFHLQHLIKNNCAITLLKNPFQRGTLSFFQGLKFGIAMVQ